MPSDVTWAYFDVKKIFAPSGPGVGQAFRGMGGGRGALGEAALK